MDVNVYDAQMGARCCLIIHSRYISVSSPNTITSSASLLLSHTISFIVCLSAVHVVESYIVGNRLICCYWWMGLKMVFSVLATFLSTSSLLHPSVFQCSTNFLTWAITRLISYSRTFAYWTEQIKGEDVWCMRAGRILCRWRGGYEPNLCRKASGVVGDVNTCVEWR